MVLSAFWLVLALALGEECLFPVSPHPLWVPGASGEEVELSARGGPGQIWYVDPDGLPVLQVGGAFEYAEVDAAGFLRPSAVPLGFPGGPPRRIVPAPFGARPRPESWARGSGTGGPATGAVALSDLHPLLQRGLGNTVSIKDRAGPRPPAMAQQTGTLRNLVIGLRFLDHGPGPNYQNRTLPSAADLGVILNAPGGHPVLAPTGSVRDLYLENSYGLLTLDSTPVAWVDVPGTEAYYANGSSGLTSLTWDLIVDALTLADPLVDFNQFDADLDGRIDAITFIHSGYGAEWLGVDQYGTDSIDRIWSHRWSIPTWTSAEGVTVSDYSINPGLWGVSGAAPGRIGVIAHELGHFFGLPDMYDTDGSSAGGGNWDLMAGGAWGFDGSQHYPSHLSPWCKTHLGWLNTLVLPADPSVFQQLCSAAIGPDVVKVQSGYPPGEYLLLEHRSQAGFDGVIPQEGLLVWHVDETRTSNNDEGIPGMTYPLDHFRAGVAQADGLFDLELNNNRGDAGDVYVPGGVDTIDATTVPGTESIQSGVAVPTGNAIQTTSMSFHQLWFGYTNSLAPHLQNGSLPGAVVGTPYSVPLSATGNGTLTFAEYIDTPTYTETDLGSSWYGAVGVPQGWHADDAVWPLALPFEFPFYSTTYDTVYVSSNGFLDFAPVDSQPFGSASSLRYGLRIAPLWDDLRTDLLGGEIYVHTAVPGEITIRWAGETYAGGTPISFSAQLFEDGRIRFHYGGSNNGVDPVVGLSAGENAAVHLAQHHGATGLNHARSLEFNRQGSGLPPGLALSPAGLLHGTPTTAGTFPFQATVTDTAHRHDLVPFTLAVGATSTAALTLTAFPARIRPGDTLTLHAQGALPQNPPSGGLTFLTAVSGSPFLLRIQSGYFNSSGVLQTSFPTLPYDPAFAGAQLTFTTFEFPSTGGARTSNTSSVKLD